MNVGRSKYCFGVGFFVCLFCFVRIVLDNLRYPDTDLLCNFELLCTRTKLKITEGNYASLTLMYH